MYAIFLDKFSTRYKSHYIKHNSTIQTTFSAKAGWAVLSDIEKRIKEKVEKYGKPLKEWDIQINYGIKTGFNEAFIIDGKTKDELIRKSPKSVEIIYPILRGRDIQKYYADWQNLYIIFTRRGTDIELYPAIKEYLFQFYEDLKPKSTANDLRGRKAGTYKWYEIQDNIAYYEDFKQEKIVWLTISDNAKFAIDGSGAFCLDSTFIMTGSKLHSILACLNSKLIEWYFDGICPSTGVGTNQWKKFVVEQIPIPEIKDNIHKVIQNKIHDIELMKDNHNKIQLLENELNEIIFTLYSILPEEIEFIENQDYTNYKSFDLIN